jgi:hypothetical protein
MMSNRFRVDLAAFVLILAVLITTPQVTNAQIGAMPADGTCREVSSVFTATVGTVISIAPHDFVWFDVLNNEHTGYSSLARKGRYDRWSVKPPDSMVIGQYVYCGYVPHQIEARLRMEAVSRAQASKLPYKALPNTLGPNGDNRSQMISLSCTEGARRANSNIGFPGQPVPTPTPIPNSYSSDQYTFIYFGEHARENFTVLDPGTWEIDPSQLEGEVDFKPYNCSPEGVVERTVWRVNVSGYNYIDNSLMTRYIGPPQPTPGENYKQFLPAIFSP